MKILACLDDPVPAGGECLHEAWVDYSPTFFAGWTVDQISALVASLLGLWAVMMIFRVLHRWAQTDLNF